MPHFITKSLHWSLKAFLLLTLICIFVPFSPSMPSEGLDASWVFGVNQMIAQGLSFGQDISFSLGPYISIYTKAYHPFTDHLMLLGSLYLAISYWLAFSFLTKNNRWLLLLAFLVLFVSLNRDSLLFIYPLLAGLTCFNFIDSTKTQTLKDKFKLIILFLPFGLLTLIKGTLLILCGTMISILLILFLINKKWDLIIVVLSSYIGSIILFWLLSGQSIINLPFFLASISYVISGYTEAMAISGSLWEVISYIVASAFLLSTVFFAKHIPLQSRLILSCMFLVFLFLVFKEGFIRHDIHAVTSGASVLIAALLISIMLKLRQILIVIFFSGFSFIYINGHYIDMSKEHIMATVKNTYYSSWKNLRQRLTDKNWPETDFNRVLKKLKEKAQFPLLQGTTDIYSHNQSYLIASGNVWNPRPMFQSLTAYTPELVEKNKNHLLGATSPDNVIFKIEPIDGRFPPIEDGASWPVLLTLYKPVKYENDFLFLQKRLTKTEMPELLSVKEGTYTFGETITVPKSKIPLFVEITIAPTILGQLAKVLFKTTPLQISVKLENNTIKSFRVIAGMTKSGFMISPLIEKTIDFGMLYGKKDYLHDLQVKSFSIKPVYGKIFWKNNYTILFKRLNFSHQSNVLKYYKLDKNMKSIPKKQISMAKNCDATIDVVNGVSPAPASLSLSGLLNISGWLVKSISQGTLPDDVFLILSDSTGKNIFYKTRPIARPDVRAYFNRPSLNMSGYISTVDISNLEGTYTLGLAFRDADRIKICPQKIITKIRSC